MLLNCVHFIHKLSLFHHILWLNFSNVALTLYHHHKHVLKGGRYFLLLIVNNLVKYDVQRGKSQLFLYHLLVTCVCNELFIKMQHHIIFYSIYNL